MPKFDVPKFTIFVSNDKQARKGQVQALYTSARYMPGDVKIIVPRGSRPKTEQDENAPPLANVPDFSLEALKQNKDVYFAMSIIMQDTHKFPVPSVENLAKYCRARYIDLYLVSAETDRKGAPYPIVSHLETMGWELQRPRIPNAAQIEQTKKVR
ncbi:MAG: hypothetical protein FWE17_01620 [Alphaproteobacteria bacterium]|nr:hypothetical protein [Alphaproteobacteria bacterium]MCL2758110.1 hypothetical protein [Alphaproteobacteria bacterium]